MKKERKGTKESVATIELEDVVKVATALERLSDNWVALLAERMYGEEEDYAPDKARQRVYAIKNGATVGIDSRALFITKGIALHKDLSNKIASLKEQVSKLAS